MTTLPAQDLSTVFAVLDPRLGLHAVPVTPTLYPDLDRDFDAFRGHVLVAVYAFTADWPTWERHPAGDELVMLLEGAATLVVRTEAGDTQAVLQPGQWVRVPRGLWHTARVGTSARMLFITPGEGTENVGSP